MSTVAEAPGGMRRLGRDAMIYGAGVVLSRAASFIMLPIYTRYLTPADYGILQLLDLTLEVATILLAAGLTAGVLRFYYKAKSQEVRNSVMSTALILVAGTKSIGTVALLLSAPWVALTLLDSEAHANLVRIAALNFLLGEFTLIPMAMMQVQQRPMLFTIVSVSRLVLQLGLNILFVVILGAGVQGILISSLITCIVGGAVLTTWMLRQTGLRISRPVVRDLVRFGLPYKLSSAGSFVLTFGDRFFLKAYVGLAAVGLYGLAYQFGFVLLQLTSSPFLQAWNPHRFQAVDLPRAERDHMYNQGFLLLNLLLITLAVAIAVFVRPLLVIMSDPAFHRAADFVPIILAAQVLLCWASVFDFGAQVSERTHYVTYATWISTVVILVLYWQWIPRFGPMGAAYATLAAFAVRCGLQYYWSQKLWPITYDWRPHRRLVLFGTGAVVADMLVPIPDSLWSQVGIGTLFFGAYLVSVWKGGVLDDHDRSRLIVELRRRIQVLRTRLN